MFENLNGNPDQQLPAREAGPASAVAVHHELPRGTAPLVSRDSLEELRDLADRNSNDIAANLALAAAYTRQRNFEGALQVYRRIARNRGLSPFLVQVMFEDLAYVEAEAGPTPRLFLVRGDLYINEGRYREAMEEYGRMPLTAGR